VLGFRAKSQFTFIQLAWNEPAEPNGVITHYEVTYTIDDNMENVDNVGLNTSHRILQLMPQTVLNVLEAHVSAYNGVGRGDISRLFSLSTLETLRK
jgi:hypothetical protein